MKPHAVIAIVATFMAMALGACSNGDLVGSGNVTSQERHVDAFHSVDSRTWASVRILPGKTTSVRVEADDNVIDHVKTSVVNGILYVTMDGPSIASGNIVVYASTPALDEVVLNGSGDVDVAEGLTARTFNATIFGSGSLSLANATADTLNTSISGSGSMSIAGTFDTHNCTVKGSGTLTAFDATTTTTAVAVFASGGANVNARKTLLADIFGSGNIIYDGDPVVRANLSGSGNCRKR